MSAACRAPLAHATLVAYWLGELDGAAEAAVEEHYLACGTCSAALDDLLQLLDGVRAAFAAGAVASVLTAGFVARLAAHGLRVREYRVPRNGSVNCSIGAEDDLVIARLEAPLEGVHRLDAIVLRDGPRRLEDIPFDAASGTVVVAPNVRHLRSLPAHRQVMRLIAVDEQGERTLGEYTFDHTPG